MSHGATVSTTRTGRVLFVSHEASRTGAPMFLLHLLRWLRANTDLQFELLLDKGGPLEADFAKVATVHSAADVAAKAGFLNSFDLIYSNTACNGGLLEELGCGDVPVLTHAHELDMGYHWLGARHMASVVSQSNRYIACAEAVAARLRRVFRIPGERIAVHYEMIDVAAVDENAAAADATALREEHDIPEGAFVVAGCGTVDLRKGTDLFVQLAARLKRAIGADRPMRFLWIGSKNTPDLVALMRHEVRKLGLETEVKFIGEMPSPHGLLALSDAFCLTSREDPFPLVMLEAAALGRPVVCFDGAGGGREFCDFGGGIAVPYLDVGAMASTCAELMNDTARSAKVGGRASELVRNRFTVDAIAPGIWNEIRKQLRDPAPMSEHRIAASRPAEIFATWALDEAPQPEFIEAHFAREAARHQARQLVAEGRKAEAIRVLVKAASRDISSRIPAAIFEGLLHIGDDLAGLEPRHAANLLGEAERIARSNPFFKISRFRERSGARPAQVSTAA